MASGDDCREQFLKLQIKAVAGPRNHLTARAILNFPIWHVATITDHGAAPTVVCVKAMTSLRRAMFARCRSTSWEISPRQDPQFVPAPSA